ncbi:beta-lactamase family protein [Nocardioides sp. TF02-7]|nr:serine hydrolase domain-containing protein [Nocardioides sp. TF02-7]UMG91953.1 beta-lactamase family protein [Nocardioides sp. TF02-7]
MTEEPGGDPTADRLAAAVSRAARRRAGVAAGYVDRQGRILVHGAGHTRLPDGPAPDQRTLFEIGSVTKTFTATLLACAVVAGEVDLDTPVAELVPEVAPLERDGVPVTLKHLATHTSGLTRIFVPVVRGSVEMLRGRDPYAGVDEAALVAGVRGSRLKRTPGTGRSRYSNTGMGLLGLALARLAGTSYGELVRTRIAGPLGMADTATDEQLTADQRARLATGHHRRRSPAAPWPLVGLPGAGALRSTVHDQLLWLRAQADPPTGDLGDAIRLTQQEHHRDTGLGWMLHGGLQWHNGGTGGFRSYVAIVPETGDAVAVLANHARGLDLVGMRLLAGLSRASRPAR